MQVSVENSSSVEKRLTIEVPAEEVDKQVNARLREIGKQVNLKGFRPGRVPFSVLKQRFGAQATQEVVQQTAQTSLQQAVEQESLRIAANPRLEKEPVLDKESGLQINAIIEVYPDLGAIEVADISIERPKVQVTDQDVTDMLETLKTQKVTWEDVERTPADKDQVLLEYTAETAEGKVPPEDRLRLAIIMTESGFDALEEALKDMSAGDEKELDLEFPENFREPQLAGVQASVALTVSKVQQGKLPEVDEEFIKSFGVESGDLDELKTEIRNNLERELEQAVNTQLKTQLAERLLEMHADMEVPESIVTSEAYNMLQQMIRGAEIEITEDMLEHFKEPARKRVRSGLLLGELARQNDIAIDGARVRNTIEQVAQTYEQPAEVVQMYYSDEKLLHSIENSVLESQVVDWVVENAKVTDKAMSFQEAINTAKQAAG